jgi:hypothetical protein
MKSSVLVQKLWKIIWHTYTISSLHVNIVQTAIYNLCASKREPRSKLPKQFFSFFFQTFVRQQWQCQWRRRRKFSILKNFRKFFFVSTSTLSRSQFIFVSILSILTFCVPSGLSLRSKRHLHFFTIDIWTNLFQFI